MLFLFNKSITVVVAEIYFLVICPIFFHILKSSSSVQWRCIAGVHQGQSYIMGRGCLFKVSQNPLKQNRNVSKNKTVPLYTYFYNISLNVLRPTFFNIYNLPFLCSPNIGKIRVKVGPKTNYFFLLYELLHQQKWSFRWFFFTDM